MTTKTFKEFKHEFKENYKKDIFRDIAIADNFISESIDNRMIPFAKKIKHKLLTNQSISENDNEEFIELNYIVYLYSFKSKYAGSLDEVAEDSYEFYVRLLESKVS